MKLDYIDIHSHLNLPPLVEKRQEILEKMKEQNIGTITVGIDIETSQLAIEIAEQNVGQCWATVGFHPTNTHIPTESEWQVINKMSRNKRVVAIGETGLDYFRDQSPETKQRQAEIFKRHILLAQKISKPLMLHVRTSRGTDDAYYDALQILQEMNYQGKADFHFFSGSVECMQLIVDTGYVISVDGPITFCTDYDEMIRTCPIDRIMIETDAPYAAPSPYRGKTCEPWMVIEVARKIAELKGLEIEIVREQVMKNTKEFFGI